MPKWWVFLIALVAGTGVSFLVQYPRAVSVAPPACPPPVVDTGTFVVTCARTCPKAFTIRASLTAGSLECSCVAR